VSDVVFAKRSGRLTLLCFVPSLQLLGEATDQLSIELGQTLGALLNASFGNAVEIIVGIAALLQGQKSWLEWCETCADRSPGQLRIVQVRLTP
jgi:calcium/proton exchanger cax